MQLQYYLEKSSLLTPDQVSTLLQIPVNVKDRDVFHVTLEDYLLALTGTVEELARLAPNSVTMGDYARPVGICRFVKDVHAGFQLLNLKNDSLRRRSDGIKYSVSGMFVVVGWVRGYEQRTWADKCVYRSRRSRTWFTICRYVV